jgi:hypothetical protein
MRTRHLSSHLRALSQSDIRDKSGTLDSALETVADCYNIQQIMKSGAFTA